MARVQFRIPDEVAEMIQSAYPGLSLGEAVKTIILELLAGEIEKRSFPEELLVLAKAELVKARRRNRTA